MNLALGLAAVDEYFKEGDRRVIREREGKRFGWEEKRAESEMSLLDDKTAAARAGYRDTIAETEARSRLRPKQTELSAARTQAELDRQPDEAATAATQAKVNRSNAEFAETQIPTVQATTGAQNKTGLANPTVDAALAGQASDNIAQTLAIKGAQGILAKDQQTVGVLAALAKKIESGDDAGALQFANEVAAIPNLLPGTNGMKFTKVTAIPEGRDDAGNTGPGRVFETADGQRTFIADTTLRNAYRASLGAPEYGFIHDKDSGAIFATDKRSGRVQNVVPADPARPRGSDKQPADIQKANWLIKNGIARDEKEAWAMVTTAKADGQQAFIQKYINANAGLGKPTDVLIKEATAAFQEIRRVDGAPYNPTGQQGSNSASAGKVGGTTKFDSILGIR